MLLSTIENYKNKCKNIIKKKLLGKSSIVFIFKDIKVITLLLNKLKTQKCPLVVCIR
jgi:hypothetical protein